MRDTPAPVDGDAPPPRIGGRYRLGEVIGRGGMSTVYRAHDEQLDRPVALKRLRAELDEEHRFTARFAGEAKRAASINHANVVALYDVGTDGGPYIVMELVEGGDLAALLRTNGHLSPEHAARITADAAAGLQAAHDAGVTHRDVKPGNILIGPDGRGMVSDFGIGRAVGDGTLTKTGAVLGSVDYFSPEQTRGERAGPPSDIYALGVVLYELLTGQRPFRGDSPYAIAVDRLHRPAPDPRDIRPDIPAGLAGIVTTAMALDPADRFASASELNNALAGWLGADRPVERGTEVVPVAASRVESPARAPDQVERRALRPAPVPASRSRSWMAAAMVLGLLLVGGYVGGRLLAGDEVGDVLPEVIVGSPGGFAFDNATDSPAPTVAPSEAPSVTASPPPPTSTPAPAAATPAPTATTRPAGPTPVPVAAAGPADTVAAFYGHVAAGRFDAAYDLWSARMKAAYPREGNLDGRFEDTASITFDALYVASQSADAADVQANFTERYDSGSSRGFIGYWRLVRVDGRWLLDEPNY